MIVVQEFDRTVLEIDLSALQMNVALLRQRLRPGAKLAAVVKGDGYGHGLVEVSRAAVAGGADWLAVALVEEGLALRESGVEAPVLVMGYVAPGQQEVAVEADLAISASEAGALQGIAAAAARVGKRARIHLKVDTGLHRYGANPEEVLHLFRLASSYPRLQVEGLFSHFAAAYKPDRSEARAQFGLFTRVCQSVSRAGYHVPLKHIANSPAFLHMPETHMDMVRVGRLLYGVYPEDADRRILYLKPALRWVSRVAVVRRVPAGQRVGYYPAPRLPQPRTVGIVPVGYADGVPETLAGRGWFLAKGRRAPILGVSMDATFVDVTEIPGVGAGDEVVIIGAQEGAEMRAEDFGAVLGVCPVSLFTGMGRRAPRVYLKERAASSGRACAERGRE